MEDTRYRIGIDIGGTFTDFTILDSTGAMTVHKIPTTPHAPAEAVFAGTHEASALFGLDTDDLVRATDYIVHGSTISTNTVIQRSGARVGLLCTEGFRDILEIGDGHKPEVYNLKLQKPDPIIPRHLRRGVRERIDYSGVVVTPLDEVSVLDALDYFRREAVDTIAVVYLWANVNPEHERQTAEIVKRELPETPVILSSDVLPLIREWPRTCATVLSSYVLPGIAAYLSEIEGYFRARGLARDVLIVQCTGGSTTVDEIVSRPVYSLLSGPALAPVAAREYAQSLGVSDVISIDMGGTSFDVCLMQSGDPVISNELRLADIPLGVMATDIHSIGAGGGSIASVDAGGALVVGPRSAGSDPGPVSYGRGGTEPTVTDANLVLGYLDPDTFLGGELPLYPEKAGQAIAERIAAPLGISTVEAAAGIFRLVNHHMVQGISFVSIERGLDPRGFVLVAGGGAGPAHAGMLAEELGIQHIVIPREAGALSAAGMVMANVTHDVIRTLSIDSPDLTVDLANEIFANLERLAAEDLKRKGLRDEAIRFRRFFDASYVGQVHELMVPAPLGQIESIDELISRFHEAHEQLYTYRIPENPVRFYHWRVRAIGETGRQPRREQEYGGVDPGHAHRSDRQVYFEQLEGFVTTPIYDGDALRHGNEITGPAVVETPTTTVVVFPDHHLTVNAFGDFVYTLEAQPHSASRFARTS